MWLTVWRLARERFRLSFWRALLRHVPNEPLEPDTCPELEVPEAVTVAGLTKKWVSFRAPNGVMHTLNDSHHVIDGLPCWCGPRRECVSCLTVAPCRHGTGRTEIVIHKEAS